MKKKTLGFVLAALWSLSLPAGLWAGEVKTKEEPKKCGGYRDGQYHLKCENEKTASDGYVARKHKWKNPFSGFTKAEGHTKVKKQGSMPHSP
jgi:hypothetical protein